MSWEEIWKAVNSDIQTPLNEKMEYIGGIVPRLPKKQIALKASDLTASEKTVLSLSGKGFVTNVCVRANSSNYPNYYPVTVKLYLDQGTAKQRIITFSNRENDFANIAIDVNQMTSDSQMSDGSSFANTNVVLNDPRLLMFDKSLKVGALKSGTGNSTNILAYLDYILI